MKIIDKIFTFFSYAILILRMLWFTPILLLRIFAHCKQTKNLILNIINGQNDSFDFEFYLDEVIPSRIILIIESLFLNALIIRLWTL